MAGSGIYRKTEKGRTEIATRANRLGLRERAMLIMVDDKTTRRELLAKNSHPTSEGILNSLLADGYIEIVSGGPAAAPDAAPGAAATEAVEVSMVSASRFACRTLVSYLGPTADDLTAQIEKCKSVEQLETVLEKCRMIIQGMAGKAKSEAFWTGVSARLPRT